MLVRWIVNLKSVLSFTFLATAARLNAYLRGGLIPAGHTVFDFSMSCALLVIYEK
jgi:hypothetical protein